MISSRSTAGTPSQVLVLGYDESKVAALADHVTGAAPHVWDRALGWYFMALIDVLGYVPVSHPGYARLLGYLMTLAVDVKAARDSGGGWWLIMDKSYPGMKGKYIESSGTAVFTYCFSKAVRIRYIDRATYLRTAQKAYDFMASRFAVQSGLRGILEWEGTVEVGSLGGDGSYEERHAGWHLGNIRDWIVANDECQYYISVPLVMNDLKGVGHSSMQAMRSDAHSLSDYFDCLHYLSACTIS